MQQADIDRDEIIELARQIYGTDKWNVGQLKRLEAFAKLVDAKASAREREACAKVCENIRGAHKSYGSKVAKECAEAIRARGQQ